MSPDRVRACEPYLLAVVMAPCLLPALRNAYDEPSYYLLLLLVLTLYLGYGTGCVGHSVYLRPGYIGSMLGGLTYLCTTRS